MSSEVDRPLRADAERNRRRILEAAAELFAERGVDVGLDEIARHAGVGTGTVYRRFPHKEQLIDGLFEHHFDRLVAIAEEALTVEDSWQALVQYFEGVVEVLATNRGLMQLVLGTGRGADGVAKGRLRVIPLARRLFERARADGHLRPDFELTDFPLTYMIMNTIIVLFRDEEPELWRRYLTIILDGIRTRRDEPTPLPRPAVTLEQLDAAVRSGGLRL